MMSRSKSILLCVSLALVNFVACDQEALAFPETIENKGKLPDDGRQPLYMKSTCDENELYYPGNSEDDWICDCKPGYIYYGMYKKCFPAYERGPCDLGYILKLREDGYSPFCEADVCSPRNLTKLGDKCVKIGDPCNVDSRRVYGVNEKTITLECLEVPSTYMVRPKPLGERKPGPRRPVITTPAPIIFETDPEKQCLPGCKRSQTEDCIPSQQ